MFSSYLINVLCTYYNYKYVGMYNKVSKLWGKVENINVLKIKPKKNIIVKEKVTKGIAA